MANWNDLKGLKVTVMGLGLNGGGLASTQFFARRGAQVTVTDLRSESVLEPSLKQLEGLKVRTVLGRHEESDFSGADLVIKNPAVRKDNSFLALAKRVETDLSVFLSALRNPVLAVTGSKGKSTTASALHHILKSQDPNARIGGNITVSPLSFLDELVPGAPVVLELSSWQLADLRGKDVLHPRAGCVTNLLWDHMNVYKTQEDYAADKAEVFAGQGWEDWSLVNADQPWGEWFAARSHAQKAAFSSRGQPAVFANGSDWKARFWLEDGEGWGEVDSGGPIRLLPPNLAVPGPAFRGNCLMAGALALLFGVKDSFIPAALESFPGVEHRLERFASWRGIEFYNDTTATIPEAAAASFQSFTKPVRWIAGGTDKNIDLAAWEGLSETPASLLLLKGSATERLLPLLEAKGWGWEGPFGDFAEAVERAVYLARPGDVVLLSPGAASFEMFTNEFDRGNQFKNLVNSLITQARP